ncbi:MAG: HdeD family acid-resistance protein [Oceanicaulis sp.]
MTSQTHTATHDRASGDLAPEPPRSRSAALGLGAALILAGALAVLFPIIATFAISLTLGVLLVVYGAIQIIDAIRRRGSGDALPEALMGALGVVAGVLILISPGVGALSITVILAAFFAADAVTRLIFAFRKRSIGRRGWLIAGGVLSLLLALVIGVALPGSAAYVLGLLFGAHALFAGAVMIATGLQSRGA